MRNLEDEINAIKMEEASLKRKLNGKISLSWIEILLNTYLAFCYVTWLENNLPFMSVFQFYLFIYLFIDLFFIYLFIYIFFVGFKNGMAFCNGRTEDHENYDRLKLLESERRELGNLNRNALILLCF